MSVNVCPQCNQNADRSGFVRECPVDVAIQNLFVQLMSNTITNSTFEIKKAAIKSANPGCIVHN